MADQVEMLRVAQLERAKPRRTWFRRRSTRPQVSFEPRNADTSVFESYAVTFQMEP